MARKATDLLDVFRLGSAQAETAAEKRQKERRSSGRAAKARTGPRFEGVFLAPRQVLLGSAMMVLLCVLAFTVGVGFGRGGSGAGEGTSLQRDTLAWYLVGTVPRTDEARGKEVVLTQVLEDLQGTHGVRRDLMRARPFEDGALRGYELHVGPFPSRDQAAAYWRDLGLERARVRGGIPFRFPKYVQTRRP